jgi:glycosyltransferase involved in cell wall biosynthesis
VETPNTSRRLRVYVLTPSFPPTDGGQEKHLLELCESLMVAGAAVQVFTRRVDHDFLPREQLGSVAVSRYTPFGEIRGVGWRAAPRLGTLLLKMTWRLLLDAKRYDVVLVSGFNFMPMSAVIAGAITGKPCVVRPESPLEVAEPMGAASRGKMGLSERSLPIRLIGALRRMTARRVDRYIAISSEIGAHLIKAGVDALRIVAIPNGIAVDRFAPADASGKPALRLALGLPQESLLMIYTGRLAQSKGILMLIEAWRELAGQFPQAHLVIVGTGHGSYDDCEPALRKFIAEHALGNRVTLTGSVKNVHDYLKAGDVFVFPSDYEGFSLSLVEAMTAQLPLVSTRVGIAAELGDRYRFGLLVPPKDPPAFRDALRTLLANPELRRELGANARAAVAERYSLTAEAARYMALFHELTPQP